MLGEIIALGVIIIIAMGLGLGVGSAFGFISHESKYREDKMGWFNEGVEYAVEMIGEFGLDRAKELMLKK